MIEYLEDDALVRGYEDRSSFTFEVIDRKRELNNPWSPLDVFSNRPFVSRYGDWNVFPYGEGNNLPLIIRNIVYSNSIAPGIISRKTGLNWGKGPKLYEEKFDEEGVLWRHYQDDPEIQAWLDSWDYEKYLMKCATDFSHIESFYSKVILKKGWRLGEAPKVHSLEHIVPYRPMVVGKKQTPTHILMQDNDNQTLYYTYPLFDKFNPTKSGISILYSNLYTFCSDFFSIPHILGSIPWIIQSTNVPKFLASLTKNSINIKYHITSPKEYWDAKREDIQKECDLKEVPYKEVMLKRFKSKLLKEIQEVLSGIDNAGKFWHSEQVLVVEGANLTEVGWKITPIDQKMRDTVQSQIDIAKTADQSVSTGLGLQASLSNISESGTSQGGSEQHYALNTYMQTGIDIPESIIMEGLNTALKINFPAKKLKMGLYHVEPKMQQDITQSQRNII